MTPMADEVWLVRHGETEWSRDGRHTSTTDLPLTDEGRRVAETLHDRLDDDAFGLVLTRRDSGPARRLRLAGHADAEVDDDLAEWDYGDLEGRTTRADPRDVSRLDHLAGAGARRRGRGGRSRPGSTGWSHAAGPRADGCCCSVTATRLRALAARWLELPVSDGRHLRLDTATVSVLGWERETPVVLRWNS